MSTRPHGRSSTTRPDSTPSRELDRGQGVENADSRPGDSGRPSGPAPRIVAGIGAIFVIALVLIGVPALLISLFGNPLPTAQQLAAAARLDPDWGNRTLLTAVLPCATWIAWAFFAFPLLAEIVARSTGIRVRSGGPLFRPQHRFAAALVSAALFTAIAPTFAVAAPAAHAYTSAAQPEVRAASGTADSLAIETVAEYEEIEAGTSPARERAYRVKSGDTLWSVADRYLGSGRKYPAIVDASAEITQADGRRLSDPNLILPGWRLDIPAEHHTTTPPPSNDPGPAQSSHPDSAKLATPTTGVHSDTAGPAAPPHASATDANADLDLQSAPAAIVGGVAAVLAASLLAALRVRRRRQRGSRAYGERIALPVDEAEAVEQRMVAVEAPKIVDALHQALAHIQKWAEATGAALPELFAIRVDDEQITVYLAEPAELPAPFEAAYGDNTAWNALRTAFDPPLQPKIAPYPALVTVGTDQDGGQLLLDLEQLRVLSITGSDEILARASLNAIAAELASVPWASDIHLSLVGLPADLPFELDPYRIHRVTDVAQLCRDLRTHLADREQALLESHLPDIRRARVVANGLEAWAPFVVLIAAECTPAEQQELMQLAEQNGPAGLVVVQTRSEIAFDSVIDLHSSSAASYKSAGAGLPPLPFVPQLLGDQTLAATLELFAIATAPSLAPPPVHPVDETRPLASASPHRDDGDIAAAEPRSERADSAGPAAAAPGPYVRLLGPVDALNIAGPAPLPGRGVEFLAFLLTHQQPVPGAQIQKALWPNTYDRSNNNTRTLAKQVRSALGYNDHGHLWLPEGRGSTGFTLNPAIRTDWHDFIALTAANPASASTEDLEAALRLVRGQPLLGTDAHRGRWAWRAALEEEIIAAVLDTAETLADRALLTHDHRLIRVAARAARTVEPLSELSWQIELKAATDMADSRDIERIIDDLYITAGGGDPEYEPDAATSELIAAGRLATRQKERR